VFTLVTYKITFLLGKNTKEAIVIGTSEEECRFKLAMRYSQAAKPPLIEKMTLIESRECPVLQIGVDYMQELDRVWKEGLEFDAKLRERSNRVDETKAAIKETPVWLPCLN
jgi:hypothetical protein